VIAPLADDRGAGVIQKESRLGRGVTVARLTLENLPLNGALTWGFRGIWKAYRPELVGLPGPGRGCRNTI
jgi:hypothetical protein